MAKENKLLNKSFDELKKELKDLQKVYFGLRLQLATNQLENTSTLKVVRKNIARVRTEISSKLKISLLNK